MPTQKERILAERRFEITEAGITLQLRCATIFDVRSTGATDIDAVLLPLLLRCVTGWRDVPARDFLAGEEGALAYDPDLAEVVLDRYPAAADAAFIELMRRFTAARAAEKN